MSTKQNKNKRDLSKKEFLKNAGLVIGGAAIGSLTFLNACAAATKTVIQTDRTGKLLPILQLKRQQPQRQRQKSRPQQPLPLQLPPPLLPLLRPPLSPPHRPQ